MKTDDKVRIVENTDQERYEVYLDDELAGFTVYRWHSGERAFVHTEIGAQFEHHGLGSQLVRAAMDDMLARNMSVLPFCPFVRAFIVDHADPYLALVPETYRDRFEL